MLTLPDIGLENRIAELPLDGMMSDYGMPGPVSHALINHATLISSGLEISDCRGVVHKWRE